MIMKLLLSVLGVSILLNALCTDAAATTTAVKSRQSNSSSCVNEYEQAVQSYENCINSIDTSKLPCTPSCDCCELRSRDRAAVLCCDEFGTAASHYRCGVTDGSGGFGKKRNTSPFDCSGFKSLATSLWYPVIGLLSLATILL